MTIEFLKNELTKAEQIKDSAEKVKAYRNILIAAIDYVYEKSDAHKPEKASLLELVDGDVLCTFVDDSDIINSLHYVRILGMNAEHDQRIKKSEVKLAGDNLVYFIGFIEARETGTHKEYHKPPYMSEAATRKLYIDLYLKEAGWDVLETEDVAVAGKAEIAQGVADVHALVLLDGVDAVAVVADDQIRPRIDRRAAQRYLALVGHVVLFLTPVVGDDDQIRPRLAQPGNIPFDGFVDCRVLAVERLVGEHADGHARIGIVKRTAVVTAVHDAVGGQRIAGILIAVFAVVHHVVVFQRHRLDVAGGEHLHVLRRRSKGEGVLRRRLARGQRTLEVHQRHVVLGEHIRDIFHREREAGELLFKLVVMRPPKLWCM